MIEEYRNALESRIIKRAERDIKNGNIEKAINKYEGFFKYYPVSQQIHNKVAMLYFQKGDKKRAGRHLFFKKNHLRQKKNVLKNSKRFMEIALR